MMSPKRRHVRVFATFSLWLRSLRICAQISGGRICSALRRRAAVCLEDDLMQGTRAEDDSEGGGKATDGERGGDVCAESSSEFSLNSG